MGIALGCIGMSMQDFERCTPSEFKAVFDKWQKCSELREQSEWERVRMSCLCALQPYSKKRLSASDIMEFPWEKDKQAAQSHTGRVEESVEQLRARMQKEAERLGLK